MPNRNKPLTACLDANAVISAIAFGGIPFKVLSRLFKRDFRNVTSPQLIEEIRRNPIAKPDMDVAPTYQYLSDILALSSLYLPSGKLESLSHKADNLVLEPALMGGCDVLVTGDKKRLLPQGPYRGLVIAPPYFLRRLDS